MATRDVPTADPATRVGLSAMSIGEVARISGTPATTLRYYERRGLIERPERVGGQRRYGSSVLERLMLIKFCRIAGLSLDDVDAVLADRSPDQAATKQLARRQVEVIDQQILELQLARRMMDAVTACECGHVDTCSCGALVEVITELRSRLG